MTRKWTKDETFELIHSYQENEILWDTRSTNYRNREKKQAILNELSVHFSCSVEEIQRKLHNLRNQLSQEPYFTALKFLIPTLTPNQTLSNKSETHSSLQSSVAPVQFSQPSVQSSHPVDKIESQLDVEENDGINENNNITIDNRQKKWKRDKNDVDDELFRSAILTLQKPSDEDESFGQYIAMELKGIKSDFYKRKLKSEIRRAVVRIADE